MAHISFLAQWGKHCLEFIDFYFEAGSPVIGQYGIRLKIMCGLTEFVFGVKEQ